MWSVCERWVLAGRPPWLYYQGKYSPLLSLSCWKGFGLPPTSHSMLHFSLKHMSCSCSMSIAHAQTLLSLSSWKVFGLPPTPHSLLHFCFEYISCTCSCSMSIAHAHTRCHLLAGRASCYLLRLLCYIFASNIFHAHAQASGFFLRVILCYIFAYMHALFRYLKRLLDMIYRT